MYAFYCLACFLFLVSYLVSSCFLYLLSLPPPAVFFRRQRARLGGTVLPIGRSLHRQGRLAGLHLAVPLRRQPVLLQRRPHQTLRHSQHHGPGKPLNWLIFSDRAVWDIATFRTSKRSSIPPSWSRIWPLKADPYPLSCTICRRVFGEFGGVIFLVVCFLYKTNPDLPKKCLPWEKNGPSCHF